MPERKWYKGRPVRRTKRIKGGLIKIIFDDGLSGVPGDVVYVTEKDYSAADETGRPLNLRREFFTNRTADTALTAPAQTVVQSE